MATHPRSTFLRAAAALVAAVIALIQIDSAGAAPMLSASRTSGLSPAGETIRVRGSGFDETKGIYVALCVRAPKPTMAPAPCGGGGVLLDGSDGSSQWISSNPPAYGDGLAIPFGPGGSFDVTIHVSAIIQAATATTPAIDCRVVACGITTRADHLRSGDRSQDYFIPVTFAGPPPTTAPPATTQPPRPPTPNTPAAPTKNPSSPAGGSAASNSGAGASTGGPAAPVTPTGAEPGTAPPASGIPADDETAVTIPSSLFSAEEAGGTDTDTEDRDDPAAATKGGPGPVDEGPQKAVERSPRSSEVAPAGDPSRSGGSSTPTLVIGSSIAAVVAIGGGLLWRRKVAAVGASGPTESTETSGT